MKHGERRAASRGEWLALVAAAGLLLPACVNEPDAGTPERPNILLITFESLRTDHVGVLGGKSRAKPELPLTPNIDALADEAMVYPDAHSVTSWTLASHASLFTGLYPTVHKTRRATDKLGDSYDTIAEHLSRNGYQTAGVVSGPYLRPPHRLDQGFELYDANSSAPSHGKAHGDITNPYVEKSLIRFLEQQRDPERPFFLFTYLWDPHYDFLPPAPYDKMFVGPEAREIDMSGFGTLSTVSKKTPEDQMAYVWSQYEGEIRATDELLGRLFARMKELGLWENTVVILTADHGEEFFDHGTKGHFNNVYAETVAVPLVVKYPVGGPTGRDERTASLVDVLPTILELTGIQSPAELDGRSLLEPDPPVDREIYYELLAVWHTYDMTEGPETAKITAKNWLGVRKGDHKLVHHVEEKYVALFDVKNDPTEQQNLLRERPTVARDLAGALDRWQRSARQKAQSYQQGGTADLTSAERERLKALGYLQE